MRFTKMHGLGNDYVYINCFEEKIDNPSELAKKISDRHFGVGSDGLILICPSDVADVRMRIFNADGSEAEMCGNGIRCAAKYVYERKITKSSGAFNVPGGDTYPASVKIETGKGVLTVGLEVNPQGLVEKVCVNMGRPVLEAKDIPVNIETERVIDYPLEVFGEKLMMTCVSMGNPHAVFFCKDPYEIELEKLGPVIESHPIFPNRTNVHFAAVERTGTLVMQTWERGSGITLACGTGACAVCVAAYLTGRNNKKGATVKLPGGILDILWSEKDNCVYMTGPAEEVFEGIWPDSKS